MTSVTNPRDGKPVAIIDADDAFRSQVTRLLGAAGIELEAFACAGEYLLWESSSFPGCILLSESMPDLSGLQLLEAFVRRKYAPPVIMVSEHADVATSVRAMKSGASDFLVKPIEPARLVASVRKALALDRTRRLERFETRGIRDRYATLTDIERTVFLGIVRGRLNKQLAKDVAICERTIKTHRARLMSKLQVDSVVDLARAAMLLGITDYGMRGRAAGRGGART
jgi:FixJ family two-component response regulator